MSVELKPVAPETPKIRHLVLDYCKGNGIDIGSGGEPVVPWAIQIEQPEEEYARYNSGNAPRVPIQWRGSCWDLPFKTHTLDWVFSSHLIEDFFPEAQEELFAIWTKPLKSGGHLIVVAPDKALWEAALAAGQPPNDSHRHELTPGEMTEYARRVGGLTVIRDSLAGEDYSILFIARKE